jgi:hypothetical protein
MTATSPSPSAQARADLWDALRYGLRCLVALFGAPIALVAMHMMTPKERAEILAWLRPLEDLARALLRLEALALLVAPGQSARRPKQRAKRVVALDWENSESWPVRFHLGGQCPPSRQAGARRSAEPKLTCPWSLAERLEALLRVAENPAPHALRCARALAKNQPIKTKPPRKPHLFDAALKDAEALFQSARKRADSS